MAIGKLDYKIIRKQKRVVNPVVTRIMMLDGEKGIDDRRCILGAGGAQLANKPNNCQEWEIASQHTGESREYTNETSDGRNNDGVGWMCDWLRYGG